MDLCLCLMKLTQILNLLINLNIPPIQFILGFPPKKVEFIFTNKVITTFSERLKIFYEVYSELEEASNSQGSYDDNSHAFITQNANARCDNPKLDNKS